MERMKAKIKWFNNITGSGFFEATGDNEIYVQRKALRDQSSTRKILVVGQEASFLMLEETDKAIDIVRLNGSGQISCLERYNRTSLSPTHNLHHNLHHDFGLGQELAKSIVAELDQLSVFAVAWGCDALCSSIAKRALEGGLKSRAGMCADLYKKWREQRALNTMVTRRDLEKDLAELGAPLPQRFNKRISDRHFFPILEVATRVIPILAETMFDEE